MPVLIPPPPPFLGALDDADRAAFRELASERAYGRGVVIFHQGDDSGSVLVLTRGTVKFVTIGDQGRETIVGFAGPGELVGELAAIDGAPRSATVQAIEPVDALVVSRAAFERLLTTRPTVAMTVLRVVARRLRIADAQRRDFAAHDVVQRVAGRLVELSEHHGVADERGIEIALPLSQEELAAWVGCSREAVAKAMQVLRGLGWLETRRRRLVVLDPPALRSFAS